MESSAWADGFWPVVCSYNCAEVRGPDRGATLATPNRSSPLQAIESRKFRSVPKWLLPDAFEGGQTLGGNGKHLGNCLQRAGIAGGHSKAIGSI